MTNKTISINPALFKVGKTKTQRKNARPKNTKPIFSQELLKKKFLKRIQDHNEREHHAFRAILTKKRNPLDKILDAHTDENNEFADSLQYLHALSKEKMQTARKHAIANNTVKNWWNTPARLPAATATPPSFPDSPHVDVPFGVLKGGKKPTFREWRHGQQQHTQKMRPLPPPKNDALAEMSPVEKRLAILRHKLRGGSGGTNNEDVPIKNDETDTPAPVVVTTTTIPATPNPVTVSTTTTTATPVPPPASTPSLLPKTTTPNGRGSGGFRISLPSAAAAAGGSASRMVRSDPHPKTFSVSSSVKQNKPSQKKAKVVVGKKQTIQRKVKHRYTLGKHQNRVGVLLKNNKTRKNVSVAHESLNRKSMKEVREYLGKHNLIKIGTSAPNNILRQIYESAYLAGDIMNKNTATMLHNLDKTE